MPVIDQMARGLHRRFVIVGYDSVSQQTDRRPADKHQRRTLLAFHMKVTLIFTDRAQDQPVDPPTGERIDDRPLTVRIVIRASGENCGVSTVGYGLDSTIDRG